MLINKEFDWGGAGSLEMKMLMLPFEEMVETIKLIDELDDYLLIQLEEEKPFDLEDKRKNIFDRKKKRSEFIAFRVMLELGMQLPGKSVYPPSVH